MKKSVWLIVLLVLTTTTLALDPVVSNRIKEEPFPPPARYTNFETDNVHILRLQNYTRTVTQQVAQLEDELGNLNAQLQRIQLNQLNQPSYDTQLGMLSTQLTNVQRDIKTIGVQARAVDDLPITGNTTPALIVMMLFLFGMMGTIIIWVNKKTTGLDEQRFTQFHANLHLTNYLKQALQEGQNISTLRKHFLTQGWTNDNFDDALEKAMKTEPPSPLRSLKQF